ncbi:MAG: DUF4360 domain-containing protein, partial [Oligoflexia bacterium]|nr:DUF4360 domain-containing protein [Oligoflexia bacterium]
MSLNFKSLVSTRCLLKMLKLTFMLGVFLAMISSSFANNYPALRLGTPGYGGNGCPAGTASVTIAPDQESLSIIFDQYISQAGGPTHLSLDRKSCNVSIPIFVPNGYTISIFKIDYRGYVNIPRGGEGRFNVEYFFAGSRGQPYSKIWRGPEERNYTLTDTLAQGAMVWSACGDSVNLRVNSSMVAKSNQNYDDVLATV